MLKSQKSKIFKKNINLPFWTIIKMPIFKEYLNHTLGLTLLTPGSYLTYNTKFYYVGIYLLPQPLNFQSPNSKLIGIRARIDSKFVIQGCPYRLRV